VETAEHLAALSADGPRLAAAAETAGLDAPVPTCPGWRVRDLLAHVGGVHRWAALVVGERWASAPGESETAACFVAPDDAQLVGWFRDGHAALVRALTEADPALECWSFLRAPSPLAFWSRRQAHETAIHRVDAESATGVVTECDPAFAADGIDELLAGFLARSRGRLVADPPLSLGVRTTDTAERWHIRIEPDRRVVTRESADADCVLSGPADVLYRFLWNRTQPGQADGLDIAGDRSVLDLWRAKATIHWS
jgi:uncharacterized protein (TIGR03083 family)